MTSPTIDDEVSEAAIAEREAHDAIDRIEPVYRKGWTTVGKRAAHSALTKALRLARIYAVQARLS